MAVNAALLVGEGMLALILHVTEVLVQGRDGREDDIRRSLRSSKPFCLLCGFCRAWVVVEENCF